MSVPCWSWDVRGVVSLARAISSAQDRCRKVAVTGDTLYRIILGILAAVVAVAWWRQPQVRGRLRGRITLASTRAALLVFLVALGFLSVQLGFTWWGAFTAEDVREAMKYELIIIHAGGFLGFTLAFEVKPFWGRVVRGTVFWGLILLYLWIGYVDAGFRGAAMVVSLGIATYMGFFFRPQGVTAVKELILRWVACVVILFFGLAPAFVLTTGRFDWGLPSIAFYYFMILAMLELVRVYELEALHEGFNF